MMVINGIKYHFYEVLDNEYALGIATDKGVVLSEYIEFTDVSSGLEIDEVPYEYAKRKYELNPEIANYKHLLDKYTNFDSLIEYIVSEDNEDDSCFILYDYDDDEEYRLVR